MKATEENCISVIIPAWNAEKSILQAVSSALTQPYVKEVIAVDDGSSDQTLEILKSIRDKKLIIVSQKNRGVSVARNAGLKAAASPYILFLDADDRLHPEAAAKLLQAMKETNCDWVLAGHTCITPDGTQTDAGVSGYSAKMPKEAFEISYPEAVFNQPWAKLYKKEYITELFDPDLSLGEDLKFNLAYAKNCRTVTCLAKPVYDYFDLPSGLHTKKQDLDSFFSLYVWIHETFPDLDPSFWQFFKRHTIRYAHEAKIPALTMLQKTKVFLQSLSLPAKADKAEYLLLFTAYSLKKRLKEILN